MTTSIPTSLNFSASPGPRERHLQRKLNNPLFAGASLVSQQEINSAQRQDHVAMQEFMLQFREVVQRAVKLEKNVDAEVILMLKAQLEQQYAICSGLSGKPVAVQEAIKKLISAISATLRASSKDDPHALEKLASDDEHTQLHLQLCEHLIVSDILNPDEIIPDAEQIPALLNETEAGLQAALALFPPDRIATLIGEGTKLLSKIEAEGHSLPGAWQRLAQMESWLQGE